MIVSEIPMSPRKGKITLDGFECFRTRWSSGSTGTRLIFGLILDRSENIFLEAKMTVCGLNELFIHREREKILSRKECPSDSGDSNVAIILSSTRGARHKIKLKLLAAFVQVGRENFSGI